MYNILVVDDAIFMRNILKKILHNHRYKVVAEAATGREAVQQYKTFKPNLVLMDITMPDQNGTDAVREIMEYEPQAKIIMCSAMAHKTNIIQAVSNGAKGFIVKPFEKSHIIEIVSGFIGVPPEGMDEPEPEEDPGTTSPPAQPSGDGEENEVSSKDQSSLERRLRHELKV